MDRSRERLPGRGEITMPALDTELVKIRLVKKGSPKLWSAERIEKLIRDTVEKSKEQVRSEGKPEEIDFSRYIKDWAVRYGFTAQQAKREIDKWVADAEQQDDPDQLGLAAYAKKNFGLAGKHFEESAVHKLKQMQEGEATVRILREDVVRDYRLTGDARYNQYEFAQALQLVPKGEEPGLWAAILNDIGGTHRELGLRTESDQIHHHLTQAVEAYQAALTVQTKEALPQDWAMTQNNLGIVLQQQGTRTSGEAGKELIRQAINAYELALEIRTRQALPVQWEETMGNLKTAREALEKMP
jgi:tetratricopeptide (TPR) repeat protein